jgi:hypothetical protein
MLNGAFEMDEPARDHRSLELRMDLPLPPPPLPLKLAQLLPNEEYNEP